MANRRPAASLGGGLPPGAPASPVVARQLSPGDRPTGRRNRDLEILSWRRRGCRRHVFVGERSKDCACGDADAHQDYAGLISCELHRSTRVSGQIIHAALAASSIRGFAPEQRRNDQGFNVLAKRKPMWCRRLCGRPLRAAVIAAQGAVPGAEGKKKGPELLPVSICLGLSGYRTRDDGPTLSDI
jgi:hypothetical protein